MLQLPRSRSRLPRDVRSPLGGGLRRLRLSAAAMVTVLTVSSAGYWVLGQLHAHEVLAPAIPAPWRPFDCLYMTVITVSTIGYTETLPLPQGVTMEDFEDVRFYTMGVVLFAMLVVGFAVSSGTAFLVEGDLQRYWARRRSMIETSKLSGHFIVCGGGVTGEVILDELLATRHAAVVVDIDEARLEQLRTTRGVPVVLGDATTDEVLLQAGIERAAGLAAALPGDKDNVFLIITAKRLRTHPGMRIVSLASADAVSENLRAAGADAVVSASTIGGMRLASELFRPQVVSFLDLMLRGHEEPIRFAQMPVGAAWDGKTLSTLGAHERFGLPVLALLPEGETEFLFNPGADQRLAANMTLVTLGSPAQLSALERALGASTAEAG
ncbi:MAG: potassium channel protein [Myxococcales bacterium]|nr:potassium channel protein [Myxococcales bacterium]